MRPDSVSISIRKLDPTMAKYLIDNYGAGWPDDVELWEKVPTDGDNRHWIDVLSGKAAKEDEAGDPLVDQFHLSPVDITDVVRQLGKIIDTRKQLIKDRSEKSWPGPIQDREYIDGQIDGLRQAIKLIQGKNEFTVGEPLPWNDPCAQMAGKIDVGAIEHVYGGGCVATEREDE